jgi:hypothetical protein
MKSEVLVVQPKLRVYFVEIFYIFLGFFFLFIMLVNLPKNGVYLFQILDIKLPWLRSLMLPLLRKKIPYGIMEASIYSSFLVLAATFSYYWLKVKTTTFTFTNKFMSVAYGITSSETDNIDMIDIRDQSLHRSMTQRLIGTSRVQIVSNDKSSPNLFLVLTKFDASQVFDYLQVHSTRSIVDYRMSQDLRGSSDKIGTQYIDEKSDDRHNIPDDSNS